MPGVEPKQFNLQVKLSHAGLAQLVEQPPCKR